MQLGFIGAGSVATAIARGIGEPALVGPIAHGRATELAAEIGGEALETSREVAERADVVVLCHKPRHLPAVVEDLDGQAKAVASMLAATSLTEIEAAFPGVPVYRFMPNIPVEVRRGVFAYAPGTLAAEGPRDELLELLGRAGIIVELPDELLDAAMATMGCGPAFLAAAVESMARAGVALGLSQTDAMRMLSATLIGMGTYLEANDLDAGALRRRVATPGGLTEQGLDLLEERGAPVAFGDAVTFVAERCR